MSLIPYSGSWTTSEAAHLLRRTIHGPTLEQINTAVSDGMATTVANLLTTPPINPPVAYDSNETVTTLGQTWVDDVLPTVNKQDCINARVNSTAAWLINRSVLNNNGSIAEKMSLFWQNHFAADFSNEARANYEYLSLLYDNSLGNFKQLVIDMTTNVNMLRFLNGASNTLYSPNENYARELLELYTIGKGPQIGPGNYTNYTEQDVLEGAKILTGWTVQDWEAESLPLVSSYFEPLFHDTSTKTLSSAFGGVTINNNGASEYIDFIDTIFLQDEVARFICRKIYRWFVNFEIDATVEADIIEDLAQTMIANNYEILPVMQDLLQSQHFYDVAILGTIIKNPIEYIAGLYKSTHSQLNFNLQSDHEILLTLYYFSGNMGLDYFSPPNVGGWTAYYLEPSFSRLWINSSYVRARFDVSDYISLYNGPGDFSGTNFYGIDVLGFIDSMAAFAMVSDPNILIDQLELLYTCKPMSATQKAGLKAILTNGLPDFEWTIQYNDYVNNPGDPTYSDPVKNRLALTMSTLFKTPEYQII